MADEVGAPSVASIEALQTKVLAELEALRTDDGAEAFRIKYLGKKGALRDLVKGLAQIPPEQRRAVGAAANALYRDVEERFGQAPWRASGSASGTDASPANLAKMIVKHV